MIKFFRHIRYNLLGKKEPASPLGRVGKYLLYAIGEIILVVIGILIALQINNSNNIKQQRELEQEYLFSLQTEFKTNLKRIKDCIIENEEQINNVEDILTVFDENVFDTISIENISAKLHPVLAGEAIYTPSTGVLKDIISSGNLHLIQNKKLRQHFASFESLLDILKLQDDWTQSVKGELLNLVNKKASVRNIMIDRGFKFDYRSISAKVDNKLLFKSVEFENRLLDYYLTIKSSNSQRFFIGLKEEIETILLDIETELTN